MRTDKGTNPEQIAVSLHYDGDRAPTVSAKGDGAVAQRILQLASEHNVPIYQNRELATVLSRVALDEEIPRQLYVAVAEVIAFAYRLKDKVPTARPQTATEPRGDIYEARDADDDALDGELL